MAEAMSLLGSSTAGPSSSSASSPTAPSTTFAALAKVRATSASTLFTSASESFQPLPYSPHAPYGQSQHQLRGASARHSARSQDLPGMDPLPTDPGIVFIHPPYTDFPGAHKYPDGLKYEQFEQNPEWFLDVNDYVWENNTHTNPNAIKYPTNLEPARGWCKDKLERKDWPEGEEPRLRCTFCRRTYAGHNAKSMWRRHVLEKHKVPMSNRRDNNNNNDKPRGRRSINKENKASSVQPKEQPRDKVLAIEVVSQTRPATPARKLKFRATGIAGKPQHKKGKCESSEPPSPTPQPRAGLSHPLAPSSETSHRRTGSDASSALGGSEVPGTPELSYGQVIPDSTLSTPPPTFLGVDPLSVSEDIDVLPTPGPASPYDPQATPAFRHSPPPDPSQRPWKFDTPSHPLHSASRDFSLAMLIREGDTPLGKTPARFGSSPGAIQSSSFSTPNDSSLVTPSTAQLFGKFPRSWLVRKVAINSPLSRLSGRISTDHSPMTQGSLNKLHRRTPSAPDDWLKHGGLDLPPVQTPWRSLLSSSPARPFMELESPIVHQAVSNTSPPYISSSVPLGIGLLDPFVMKEGAPTSAEFEAELNQIGSKPKSSRKQPRSDDAPEPSPSMKRRRLSFEV